MNNFDAESYFVKRLADHGKTVYLVRTTPTDRQERIRQAIIECHLDAVIFGTNRATQKPETYSEAFQRFYNSPLHPELPRGISNAET